jgi:UDP-glucose 4-epimerase
MILQVEVIEPAVKGTANVLEACLKAKVERVVFVSSGTAVAFNPNFPKDKVIDESCWSDKDYCKKTKVAKILLLVCMTSKYHWPSDMIIFVSILLLCSDILVAKYAMFQS